jgi:hypothetical protein
LPPNARHHPPRIQRYGSWEASWLAVGRMPLLGGVPFKIKSNLFHSPLSSCDATCNFTFTLAHSLKLFEVNQASFQAMQIHIYDIGDRNDLTICHRY